MLRLEGPIDSESFWGDEITPAMFREELEAEEGDVTVWINSPGGNVFAAAEIYTMLKDYKSAVTVKIASIAASAASVIAMAGDKVQMSPTALLMIHDPSTIAMGNAKAMEQAITTLNEVKESIINAYAAKTGLRHNRIADLMSNETWMNAKKAVELGFADEVLYEDQKPEPEKEPDEDDPEDPEKEKKAAPTLEALMYQGVIDAFDQYYPRMVNAATVEDCDALYAEMLSAMETAGMSDIEAYMTEIYFNRLALWGMEPVSSK